MFGKKLIVLYVGILSASSFYMPDDDFQYSQNMLQYCIQQNTAKYNYDVSLEAFTVTEFNVIFSG